MKRIPIVQPHAADAIQEHFQYLFERSPQAASKWLIGIYAAISDLSEHADWYPLTEHEGDIGLKIRRKLYGRGKVRHQILFVIREIEVHVVEVRHGMRRPPGKLSDTD